METQTDQKVNFGYLSDASEAIKGGKNCLPNTIKEWEKIFDEEWARPTNDIIFIIEHILPWCIFTPPSRRPILLEKILNEVENPRSFYVCLAETISWKDDERKRLEKAWDNASQRFVFNEPSIIVLANSLSVLAPDWRSKAAETVSKNIAAEESDKKVREYFLEIKNPGNLSDDAYKRFLAAAADKEMAEGIILKLSWAENKDDSGKTDSHPFAINNGRNEIARKLWKEILISKFLKTRTTTEAEKIIDDFAPDSNHADILTEIKACHHLAMLMNNLEPPLFEKDGAEEAAWKKEAYETGKRIYQMVIALHSKRSLVAYPLMIAWSEFVIDHATYQIEDPVSDEELNELDELYRIVTGETKGIIAEIYFQRLSQRWPKKITKRLSGKK